MCVLPFKIQSRADLMTQTTVDALRRAGCAEVWMGVESGSQKVLDAMDKGLRVADVVAARATLGDAGFVPATSCSSAIRARPGQDIQQTIALVRNTRPDDIGISVSYPLPGTSSTSGCRNRSEPNETGPTATISASCSAQLTRRVLPWRCEMRSMRRSIRGRGDGAHCSRSARGRCGSRSSELEPSTRTPRPQLSHRAQSSQPRRTQLRSVCTHSAAAGRHV